MIDKKQNELKILENRKWIKRLINPYENVRIPLLVECQNGHCVECKDVRQLLKTTDESRYYLECPLCKKEEFEKKYLTEKPICLYCGKELSREQFKDGQKFCSQSCAATYNNLNSPHKNHPVKKQKIEKIEKESYTERIELNSIEKGAIGETALMSECLRLGIHVSKPIVDSYPYDLILEKNGKMFRFQVKTSEVFNSGVYVFTTCRNKYRSGYTDSKIYEDNEFDYFYLYSLYDDEAFIISLKELNQKVLYIRKYDENQYGKNNKENHYSKDYTSKVLLNKIFE